MHNFAYYASF